MGRDGVDEIANGRVFENTRAASKWREEEGEKQKKKGERKNEQEEGKKREQIRVKNVESKRAIERRIVCGG